MILPLVLALPACAGGDPAGSLADRPDGSAGLGAPAEPAGETAPVDWDSAPGSTGPPGDTGSGDEPAPAQAEAAASEDDLRVFAFATTDEAALAEELSALAATVARIEGDLQARDVDAAQADAALLLDQADTLGNDAASAEQRQRPLEPEDVELVAAREDALTAFGLTAAYATTAADIAEAALSLQLSELATLLEDAAALAGTSDELTVSYTELNAELLAWAESHPAEAARALNRYA